MLAVVEVNGKRHRPGGLPSGKLLTVRGCNGSRQEDKPHDKPERFVWHVEKGAPKNYRRLGELLAVCDDLFRHHSHGLALVQVLPDGKTRLIAKGSQLVP